LMPRLPDISGFRLVRVLEKFGFHKVRQKGSHVSLQKTTKERSFRTVVPLHRSLAKGTLLDILRQCGIERADFLRMLEKQ
jgi:predicted RNA binding protein YcfA (HicA-like mRNA interferase family)